MKKWKAFARISGFDFTYTEPVEFYIPDKLYERMERDIQHMIPLKSCSFYDELLRRAESQIIPTGNAENAVIEMIDIVDPSDVKRLEMKLRDKICPWYADDSENECEFTYAVCREYLYEEYVITLTFDTYGAVKGIGECYGMSEEIRDGVAVAMDECYPDYETLDKLLEAELDRVSGFMSKAG